jgi:hypothetical protein
VWRDNLPDRGITSHSAEPTFLALDHDDERNLNESMGSTESSLNSKKQADTAEPEVRTLQLRSEPGFSLTFDLFFFAEVET